MATLVAGAVVALAPAAGAATPSPGPSTSATPGTAASTAPVAADAPWTGAPFLTGPAALPAAIDPLQPYVGQTSCDPTEKPGARALLNLLIAAYPDSTDDGIVHTCSDEGSRSEHSEGRALDWGVSIHDAQQKSEGDAFVQWLFAPQGTGSTAEPAVAARRLGVMYVIWNGQIREATGSWRPYLPGLCDKPIPAGGGDDTTCHRDHVHVSLGWSGAWKRTSFWTGSAAAPLDYGPCIAAGAGIAPAYSGFNPAPCANTAYAQGGTTTGTTPAPVTAAAPAAVVPKPRTKATGPVLSAGARGMLVVHLQRHLKLKTDGRFGPATKAAVVKWQRAHRLPATGVVSGLTWVGLHPVTG